MVIVLAHQGVIYLGVFKNQILRELFTVKSPLRLGCQINGVHSSNNGVTD